MKKIFLDKDWLPRPNEIGKDGKDGKDDSCINAKLPWQAITLS